MRRVLTLMLTVALLLLSPTAKGADTGPVLPLPDQFGSSQMIDFSLSPDETEAYVYYSPANSEDLDQYLMLCAMAGTYAREVEETKVPTYRLFVPGTTYGGFVVFDIEKELIIVITSTAGLDIKRDEDLEGIYTFLSANPRLPVDATGTVLPQFYACLDVLPTAQSRTSFESVFDGKSCWTEYYSGMTNQSILTYTRFMLRFGFTVRADAIMGSEEDGVNSCILHYTKGDAEVIVMYLTDSSIASVHYKPGVKYTLLDGRQLVEALLME